MPFIKEVHKGKTPECGVIIHVMRFILRVGREGNPVKAFQQIGQLRFVADAAAAVDSTLFNVAFNLALIQLHGCKKCLHFFNTAELNAVGGNLMTGLPFGRLFGRLRGRCRFRFVNGRTCKRRTEAYSKYCCDEKIMFFHSYIPFRVYNCRPQ